MLKIKFYLNKILEINVQLRKFLSNYELVFGADTITIIINEIIIVL